jgi:hypothetical protein
MQRMTSSHIGVVNERVCWAGLITHSPSRGDGAELQQFAAVTSYWPYLFVQRLLQGPGQKGHDRTLPCLSSTAHPHPALAANKSHQTKRKKILWCTKLCRMQSIFVVSTAHFVVPTLAISSEWKSCDHVNGGIDAVAFRIVRLALPVRSFCKLSCTVKLYSVNIPIQHNS